jgi:phenylacetate-CoA ligase
LLSRLAGLSREGLEALQMRKLQRQIEHVYAAGGYYRARLDHAKLRVEELSSIGAFQARFPLSNKADFLKDQAAAPPFGTRLTVSADRVALVNATGGTSGLGQEFYGRSHRDVHMLGYYHALPWFMAGLRAGDVVVNCVPAGGMTTGGWGPGEGIRIIGATGFHVGGNLSTDAKIDLMLSLGRVDFIYASTNYLHTLTDALTRRGIDPREAFPGLRGVFIAAEGYPIEWAQKIQAKWGCQLNEGYGSTQCAGFGASTCGDGVVGGDGRPGLMRLFEWETMFEVLHPETHEPVRSGEVGELVVTNLGIEGSPCLRFCTGDAARFIAWQDAGDERAWNAIECGSIGRFDDMLKIRGNNVWPAAVDAALFAFEEVADYAARVYTSEQGKTEVEISVAFSAKVSDPACDAAHALLDRFAQRIKDRTNLLVKLVVVDPKSLPSFSYKARRWVDQRSEGYRL